MASVLSRFSEDPPTLAAYWAELGPPAADPCATGWNSVSASASLVDTATGVAPEQATTVRVALSRQSPTSPEELRVLFECVDPHPWATLTGLKQPLYTEEVVEVFLDPIGDLECYFEIEVNPLNSVLDLVLRKAPSGLRKDARWTCEGLRTAARRTADGWCAELAIPLASLTARESQAPVWRANFCRIDRPAGRPRELTAWAPTGLPRFHAPERFGFLKIPTAQALAA